MAKKQPKYANPPITTKTARAAPQPADGFLGYKPSWRIARMEFVDPFGWHVADQDVLHFIREKLSNFETMSWDDILLKAKKQNHRVAINDLCSTAQKRLTQLKLDDLDDLVSLRLTGKQRVWGIFEAGVMTLLWWDPHHEFVPPY